MNDRDLYSRLVNEYETYLSYDGVDGKRLAKRFHAISEIGLTEDGGSYRAGFSHEEREAKDLVIGWMKEAGLTISEDGAGNVFGLLVLHFEWISHRQCTKWRPF
ncbi:hypothetical protein [Salicibibacter kimchii]|uniref:hypothetical protein n=1 Tax=Salicibibacter kimchii TaxID=2099786 RepID=UPI0026B16121